MYLWAAIDTTDEFERLCAVADTAQELAEKLNIKCSTIYAHRAKVKKGILKEKYIKIKVSDMEKDS